MNKILLLYTFAVAMACQGISNGNPEETRYPLKWPFSPTSIWNMPIGTEAKYVHAHIEKAMAAGMTIDEDYIVMSPDVPLMDIAENFAGWDRTKSRCGVEGKVLFPAPVPQSWIVGPETWDGATPNAGLAVLMPDRRTIKQTQPFAHCTKGQPATSQYLFPDVDIYGDGMYGAHGATGLSAIGGTLRLRELSPTSGPVRHALKVNIYAKKNVYYDAETKGFRWPGKSADGYAAGNYYKDRHSEIVKECRMGALLALPVKMNLDSIGFETKPARILAEAFQNYGAYLVDDTAWDVYAIMTEWSPEGRFDDDFRKNWGFSMKAKDKTSAWARDMDRIFLNLHVVDNNTATSVGGGGKPRMPLAPEFEK
ncbi:MAG: hypothetical protein GZ094_02150 [Mariniphaga sp.]|nr:hypothetical protein [Mariniphaga sp.]